MYPLLSLPSAQINLNKTIDRTKIMLFVVCFSRFLNIKQKFFETRQTTIESIKIFNSIFIIRWFIAFFSFFLSIKMLSITDLKKGKKIDLYFLFPNLWQNTSDCLFEFWYLFEFLVFCRVLKDHFVITMWHLAGENINWFVSFAVRFERFFFRNGLEAFWFVWWNEKKFNKERKENLTPRSNLP